MTFEAWFRSNEELLEFLSKTLEQIEGVLRFEFYQYLRLSKYTDDQRTEPSPGLVLDKRLV
jgi:hypothetical protein